MVKSRRLLRGSGVDNLYYDLLQDI